MVQTHICTTLTSASVKLQHPGSCVRPPPFRYLRDTDRYVSQKKQVDDRWQVTSTSYLVGVDLPWYLQLGKRCAPMHDSDLLHHIPAESWSSQSSRSQFKVKAYACTCTSVKVPCLLEMLSATLVEASSPGTKSSATETSRDSAGKANKP